jgi:peptidoglycan-N-acetylglucosamine deacetylase
MKGLDVVTPVRKYHIRECKMIDKLLLLLATVIFLTSPIFTAVALAGKINIVDAPMRTKTDNTLGTNIDPGPVRVSLPKQLSFGSEKILKSCWNAKELSGENAERIVVRPDKSGEPTKPAKLMPQYTLESLPSRQRGSIRSVVVPAGIKVVALTFDLCEGEHERTGYDERIVNYLRKNRIKATLFAGGKWLRSHPEQAKQIIADPLFEIGNHAWAHGNLRLLHGVKMSDQILWTQAQYELLRQELVNSPCAQKEGSPEMERIPKIPYAFRFPYGTCNEEALNFLAEKGLAAIQWDVVTGDPTPKQTSGAIVQEVMNKTRSGSIIIMHANGRGEASAAAMQTFIPLLMAKGFRFVTVSELLKIGAPRTTQECYELKPGDNVHYDRIFGVVTHNNLSHIPGVK